MKLVVNGIDHAFLRWFGCSCTRCINPRNAANTSVSLISEEDNGGLHHILFDVGMRVVDSLVNLLRDKAYLDLLIISHWHPDHVLDLNRLCETWWRTLKGRGDRKLKLPVWCRSGTAEWLRTYYDYECRKFLDIHSSKEHKCSGFVIGNIQTDIPKLKITAISVSHCTADFSPSGEYLPCCASFIIEKEEGKKAVLLWDIDNKNQWIKEPSSAEQREAVELLVEADYLFIDCNTWQVEEDDEGRNTGHISFSTVKDYVKALSPKMTLLVHLSGHEDGEGNPGWGWDDQTWQDNAQREWDEMKLPGKVCVPKIGQSFELE